MPRPVPSIPPVPGPREPWVSEGRAAASRLATVPAFVPAPPAPDAAPMGISAKCPSGLRRAARAASWALAALAAWLALNGAILP